MAEHEVATFGNILRRFRLSAGLSQEALAEQAGMSASAIAALERGRRTAPRLSTVTMLADALGLAGAERSVLLAAATGVPASPTPASGAPRHNLPEPLSSFIGREREQEEVRRLLAQARLVTLTGCGGAGKTRLALQLASTLDEAPPDGVWLVELASLDDPGLVPGAVARVLGVPEERGKPLIDSLTALLIPADLLLVLDNCEHLVAACADLAATVLRACPRLRILATSRERLEVSGEMTYAMPPLSVPMLGALPASEPASAYEAMRLFEERARARLPDFRLTEANAAIVAHICARLDGLPLAIELAAARVSTLPVEGIAARLDDCFRLLTGGPRTTMSRQQTLRASLDWSHDLLGEPERAVLRRLAIFAGGCSLEAAESICAGDGVYESELLDLMGALVNKSLVRVEVRAGAARYLLLETVRQYARERLTASEETDAVRARHLDWYLALAEHAEPSLVGKEQQASLARLEAEHDNIRTALSTALDSERIVEGLHMAGALWRFWYTHGHLREGRTWLEVFLAAGAGPTAARAKALRGAGVLANHQGHFERAATLSEESLALYRTLGDQQGVAAALNLLGHLAMSQGNVARAVALSEESLALQRALGHPRGVAVALNTLATVIQSRGDQVRASALFAESLALFRGLGDTRGMAITLTNLAEAASAQQQYGQALAFGEESLALATDLQDTWGIAAALHTLGDLARLQGNLVEAAALYERCLRLRQEMDDRPGMVRLLSRLGEVEVGRGAAEPAAARYGAGLALARTLGDRQELAGCLAGLAWVVAAAGDAERAARLCGAAAALHDAIAAPDRQNGRTPYDRAVTAASASLGDEAFALAWASGHTTPLERVLDELVQIAEVRG